MKPQILLDIDGVLNTYPAYPRHMYSEFQDHKVTDVQTGKTYTLIIAQPAIDFLNEVHAQGLVDIRWHTTWQDSANEVAKAFGLTEFPVLDAPEFDAWNRNIAKGWWKLAAVQRVLMEGDGPVIWIDDDAGMYWVNVLLKQATKAGMTVEQWSRLTVIVPDAQSGLTRRHMNKIMKIIDIHEG